MRGTHSTLEASAQLAFISGLKLNVFRAVDGHRIRCGMRAQANLVEFFRSLAKIPSSPALACVREIVHSPRRRETAR